MEIIRADKMGFCFGVEKAVKICQELKDRKERKFILGMLVHNKNVMEELEKEGFEIVHEEDIIQGTDKLQKGDIVVIRAHGTEKNIYKKLKEKEVEILDATCLFVKKIKDILVEEEKKGKEIIFIGDKEHPEVKGVISYGNKVHIFNSLEEVENVGINREIEYSVLTQTTLNKKKFKKIKKILEKDYSKIDIFDSICGATSERQEATERVAKISDVIFIIGDFKSSNSKKLLEVALLHNEKSYLIQNENELDLELLEGVAKVGLAAGASTPEDIIIKIENKIRGILYV